MPIITIHNSETDEIIEREMNAAELAQYEKDQLNAKKELDLKNDLLIRKQNILDRLGLTEAEARLLLG